jgi:hypothetical protein
MRFPWGVLLMANPDNVEDVEALAAMGPDDLDRLLGEAVLRDGMFGKEPTSAEMLAEGRNFFNAMLPDLRRRLCGSSHIASIFAANTKDRNTLIVAVAELLSGIHWPLVLAARLIYFGYEQLCPKPPVK